MKNIIDPIPRRKLSDQIQERLITIIQSGELSPGDIFPSERELMETYSVGRPAIREAMQNLQRMGLVEIRHGERPRIAEPSFGKIISQLGDTMRHLLTHSSTSLDHLKEARTVFEEQMVAIAAERRTAGDIEALKSILAKQEAAIKDPAEFVRQDGFFHRQIARVSGNPIFEGLSESIFEWLRHFHFETVRNPGLEKFTLDEHQQILNAIEAGDPKAAVKQLNDHINRANLRYQQEQLKAEAKQ
ncbi:MAG: transcriptional regulator NanR [Rhodospirillales bacterium]|nr:transcriptional regulator NanR [Rhodospirillales bacterium]